jgi:uncharacterized membrane protein
MISAGKASEAAEAREHRRFGDKPASRGRELFLFLRDAVRDIFAASLAVYLVTVILEIVRPGFASHFFNLNTLLAVIVVSGALAVLVGAACAESAAAPPAIPAGMAIPIALALGVVGALLILAAFPAGESGRLWSALGGGAAIGFLCLLMAGVGKPGGGERV